MKLNYHQYSDQGEPLLILHGLFGNLGNWGWHSKQLAQNYAVYGIDLRNHGDSFHDPQFNYQLMAEDVRQLIAELGISSCYMIAHSMGGKVAMQLALNNPELIRKMIIVDIAPVTYPASGGGQLDVLTGMESLDLKRIKNRAEAEQELEASIPDEATRKFVLTNLTRSSSGAYTWKLNLVAIRNHYDQLRNAPVAENQFPNPVLFVKGSESNYIQDRNREDILKLFPAASVKTILQAGHWLHAEQPQAFQNIAKAFLEAVED